MVGCSNDALTHEMKGKTVCTDEERYEAIRHCRYVDIVIPDGPWSYSLEFFNKYKIDFIAHDEAPYTIGGSEGKIWVYLFYTNFFSKNIFLYFKIWCKKAKFLV